MEQSPYQYSVAIELANATTNEYVFDAITLSATPSGSSEGHSFHRSEEMRLRISESHVTLSRSSLDEDDDAGSPPVRLAPGKGIGIPSVPFGGICLPGRRFQH